MRAFDKKSVCVISDPCKTKATAPANAMTTLIHLNAKCL